MIKAFKFKLKTDKEIENIFSQYAGCRRFVWNKALALIKNRMQSAKINAIVSNNVKCHKQYSAFAYLPNYSVLSKMLTFWKKSGEYSFLKIPHAQPLQQALKDLTDTMQSAFTRGNGIRFPKFRKKYKCSESFRYPQSYCAGDNGERKQGGFQIKGNRIKLPKIGWVKFYKSRDIDGKPKQVTIKHYADGWYISVLAERYVEDSSCETDYSNPVGIDAGVKKTATLSNGHYFKPINTTNLEKKLIKAQRILDRKQHPRYRGDRTKSSANFHKQTYKIKRIWKDITDSRTDYLNKLSTAIAKNHGLVVAENLQISNMVRSAKGDIDNPGRRVKQKSGLNRSILRQSWGKLYSMLAYKVAANGGMLLKVDPKYTSQTCPACHHTDKENRLTQERFTCIKCSFSANADLTAAFNILTKGLGQLSELSGKENPCKTLPQGMSSLTIDSIVKRGLRKVTPEEYGDKLHIVQTHTTKQEPAGKRKRKRKLPHKRLSLLQSAYV